MMLCEGDLVQLKEIRQLNVEQYLILLARKTEENKTKQEDVTR
jgi:hypothetical protein